MSSNFNFTVTVLRKCPRKTLFQYTVRGGDSCRLRSDSERWMTGIRTGYFSNMHVSFLILLALDLDVTRQRRRRAIASFQVRDRLLDTVWTVNDVLGILPLLGTLSYVYPFIPQTDKKVQSSQKGYRFPKKGYRFPKTSLTVHTVVVCSRSIYRQTSPLYKVVEAVVKVSKFCLVVAS